MSSVVTSSYPHFLFCLCADFFSYLLIYVILLSVIFLLLLCSFAPDCISWNHYVAPVSWGFFLPPASNIKHVICLFSSTASFLLFSLSLSFVFCFVLFSDSLSFASSRFIYFHRHKLILICFQTDLANFSCSFL